MPLPLSVKIGLGMKVTVLPYWLATLRIMYLYNIMMMALDRHAAFDHGLHHLAAQVLVMICGRHRKVAFFIAGAVPEAVLLAAGIPAAFLSIDEVIPGVLILIEADVVENEKLGFGP